MAGRLRALSPPSAGNGEPLGGGGQGYGWMEAAGASDLAFMVLHRRRERATSVRTSSNGGLCGTKIPNIHTAAIGFGRKNPPRPAGGLGRSAITLDMGDIGTLPARRRRRAIAPEGTAPEEGLQQGNGSVEASPGGGASPEQDAAVGASEDGWGRRPGQLSGRHGGDVLFFVVV